MRYQSKKYLSTVCGITLASACSLAYAIEPAAIDMGAFQVYPELSIGVGTDSNYLRSNTNEQDSIVTTVSPSISAIAQQGANSFTIDLSLSDGSTGDSSNDDYTDTNISLGSTQVLNGRNQFVLGGGYSTGHEARGTGLTLGNATLISEPIEFHTNSLNAGYTLGALGAQGKFDVTADYDRKIYDNFRTVSPFSESRDIRTFALGAQLTYEISVDTRLLLELRNTDADYVLASNNQDNADRRYLVGVEWDATGKTSGFVKGGWQDKQFYDDAIEDFDAATWEVGINYAWKAYSSFDFSTQSAASESSGLGDYLQSKSYALNWNHQWADRFSTVATVSNSLDDYIGVITEDETTTVGISATYNMHRYMDWKLDISNTQVDSTTLANDHDRNLVLLTAIMSL